MHPLWVHFSLSFFLLFSVFSNLQAFNCGNEEAKHTHNYDDKDQCGDNHIQYYIGYCDAKSQKHKTNHYQ